LRLCCAGEAKGRSPLLDCKGIVLALTRCLSLNPNSLKIVGSPTSALHSDSYITLGCSGVTAVVAWCCLVYATAVCDFMEVKGTNPDGNQVTINKGIWNTQGPSYLDTTCRGTGGYAGKDSKWKAAEAMSIIACIIGGFAILPLVCAAGKKLRLSQTISMTGGCMKACLFGGLTLLMKRSHKVCYVEGLTNPKCELGDGARFAIVATVLFFVASISIQCAFVRAVVEQQEGGGAAAVDVEPGDEEK